MENLKRTLRSMKFLMSFSWRNNKKYVFSLFGERIISVLLPFTLIIFPKFIIDELVGGKDLQRVLMWAALLVGCNLVGGALKEFLTYTQWNQRIRLFEQFNVLVGRKIMRMDFEHLERPEMLDLKDKAYKSIGDNGGEGFGVVIEFLADIVSAFIALFGVMYIISTLNIYIVALIVVLVIVNSLFDGKIAKANYKVAMEKIPYERKFGYLFKMLWDFSFGKEMRLGNMCNWIIGKFENQLRATNRYYKKVLANQYKSHFLSILTTFIREATAYGYLIYRVLFTGMGIGDFTMYLSAISKFSDILKNMFKAFISVDQLGLYVDDLIKFLNLSEGKRTGERAVPAVANNRYEIVFDKVSFRYPGSDRYILRDVSITIKAGEKLSIIGENGAGKTTFVKLLTRLYDPTEGRILVNGMDIKSISYDEYMAIFSVVFQDFKLFAFNIKENIALAESDRAEDREIIDNLERSGLENRLKTLEKGLDTSIYKIFDEKGIELSGGEGQKLAIARALYKDAPIVVLDEPTAALDPRAEYEIYRRFDELVNGKTAVYISHRLSSARFCDKIAVFSNGQIVEYGNHKDLIKKNGMYTELFNMQAQFYVDAAV